MRPETHDSGLAPVILLQVAPTADLGEGVRGPGGVPGRAEGNRQSGMSDGGEYCCAVSRRAPARVLRGGPSAPCRSSWWFSLSVPWPDARFRWTASMRPPIVAA